MFTSQDAVEAKPHQDFATSILTVVVVALAVVLGILLELHRERSHAQVASPSVSSLAISVPETKLPQTLPLASTASESNIKAGAPITRAVVSTVAPASRDASAHVHSALEAPGGLTVYQNDKVVFSMPASAAEKEKAAAHVPAQATESIVAVLDQDAAEKLLAERVEPDYPPQALAARIQGSVQLNMTIDTAGQVVRARVSDGPPELAQAAAEAVRRWRFHPYTVNGQPKPFRTTTVIDFKLQ